MKITDKAQSSAYYLCHICGEYHKKATGPWAYFRMCPKWSYRDADGWMSQLNMQADEIDQAVDIDIAWQHEIYRLDSLRFVYSEVDGVCVTCHGKMVGKVGGECSICSSITDEVG